MEGVFLSYQYWLDNDSMQSSMLEIPEYNFGSEYLTRFLRVTQFVLGNWKENHSGQRDY
jgi:hypothetical protein